MSFFGQAFFFKERLLVKLSFEPLQGLRGGRAEPHKGKKVVFCAKNEGTIEDARYKHRIFIERKQKIKRAIGNEKRRIF